MLDALFKPRSVAIVGASNNPLSIGHIVIQNLVDHNFRGAIFPINPKAGVIKSFKSYPSVLDVPDEIDLVNISIKNTLVPAVLEDCGRKGVKFAIVHTSGFKEMGEEGLQLERQLVEVAHKHGMRVYGPNSQGIQNSDAAVSVYANFTFVPQIPSNISIVAQSGGVGETLKLNLFRVGVGTRMYASYGNEADVGLNDIIAYYGEDEDTGVIMVSIETLKDPAGFLEITRRITPHKPVLVLKTGRTEAGIKAVASHTGSMIDQSTMMEAIFRKSGILSFNSQQDMVEAAVAFSSQPVPRSKRVVFVTNTGGPAIIAVDKCTASGLEMAELSPQTRKSLGELLFTEASISNPVDVVATAGADQYGGTLEALLADPNLDSILLNMVTPPFVDCEALARRLAEIGKASDKPILCVVMTIAEKFGEVIRLMRESGMPVYDYAESAAQVLAAMIEYGQIIQREEPVYPTFDIDRDRARELIEAQRGVEGFLPQETVFELLNCYGIPVAGVTRVEDREALLAAAESSGYPVVLKVDAEEVVHKTDAGGVVLNIENQTELLNAFEQLSRKFAEYKPAFVVQRYLAEGREVILGLKGNANLQPTLMFGLGGLFVETLKDVQFRLTPLSTQDADELMRSIKGFPLLEGVRGEQPGDTEQLGEILIRLSQLAVDFAEEVDELDLNPALVFEKGKGVCVVDARLRLRTSS